MNLPDHVSQLSHLQQIQQLQALLQEQTAIAESLKQENASLKHQLALFTQQMFGEKSEKRLIDNPDQLAFGDILKAPESPESPETETITYERRKKQRPEDSVTDQGLHFNDSVPVELIHMPAPQMQGEDANQYEIIGHKNTYRLAQRPDSYVVLQYQRDVVRHKPSQTLTTVAAPPGLFDRSFADIRFIASMLVDKYLYHLPLYRQNQRLAASAITISRGTLTKLEQRAARLLEPIAQELLKIPTNLERALRCIPMGRKNWMFCWTLEGALQCSRHSP